MDYIRGVNRDQVMLFPESVEDYITEDNAVRFMDAFVASLDLEKLGFTRAQPAETGRPAYDPGDLLRLYLYGYLNRARSSRMLERETKVNIEVMWLFGEAAAGLQDGGRFSPGQTNIAATADRDVGTMDLRDGHLSAYLQTPRLR